MAGSHSSIWDQLSRLALGLLVLAALLGVGLWYEPVVLENQRMREEKLTLDHKITLETETARRLDASLRAMEDPITVERLARERLSYARAGEDIIHFEAPVSSH
jgi:hypothetical protein